MSVNVSENGVTNREAMDLKNCGHHIYAGVFTHKHAYSSLLVSNIAGILTTINMRKYDDESPHLPINM